MNDRWFQYWRRCQTRIGNNILFLLAKVMYRFSASWAFALGRAMGRITPYLSSRHFRQVCRDIDTALGDRLQPGEAERLARRFYLQMGENLAEFLRLPYMTTEDVLRTIRLEGAEHLDAALAQGHGAILQFAHLGNWEVTGTIMGVSPYPVTATSRPQVDTTVTDLLTQIRVAHGLTVITMNDVRGCIRLLKRNEVLGVAGDLNASTPSVFVNVFDRPAASFNGTAFLALTTGAPIMPIFAERLPDKTHRVVIGPPIPVEKTGDRARDMLITTMRLQRVIEREVLRRPADWFWLLQRWKTRPEDVPHPERVPMEHRDLTPDEVSAALACLEEHYPIPTVAWPSRP